MNWKGLLACIVIAGMCVNSLFITHVFYTIGTEGEITITHVPEAYQQYHWTVWIEFIFSIFILVGGIYTFFRVSEREIKDDLERNSQGFSNVGSHIDPNIHADSVL